MTAAEDGTALVARRLAEQFKARFGGWPSYVVRAPGRVNLIGEHTDYNDGFVLPMAIDRATWLALRPSSNRKVRLCSLEHADTLELDLDALREGDMSWHEYPKGVAWALEEAGFSLAGFDAVSLCQVPMGAGLSSSASFELALARAFQVAGDFAWDAAKMALLCQRAENQWVGVRCGIMDQLIAAIGVEGHALLVDCRQLVTEALPLPPDICVVVLDTGTRRGLSDSAYNERRAQCEQGARHFAVSSLRDVAPADFAARGHELDRLTYQRVNHVLSENRRTLHARDALLRGDGALLGQLIDESHASLRDDFAVSSDALDLMVGLARSSPGCLGARMTGAGFGGCALALVRVAATPDFVQEVARRYRAASEHVPEIYVCRAAAGASVVTPSNMSGS